MKKNHALLSAFFLCTGVFAQPAWNWAYSAGGSSTEVANAISTDAAGNSYVTGRITGPAMFGTFSVNTYAGPDIFIAKCDAAGTWLWAKHAGSLDGQDTYGDAGMGIGHDTAGNCYVAGVFKGAATFGSITIGTGSQRNIFVAKYDENGICLWARCPVPDMANNYCNAIAVDAAGNSWITGYLGGGSNTFGAFTLSGPGGYVVKYDTNGNVVFATKLGSNGALDLYGITVDNAGNAYATGYLQGQETVASQTYTSSGMRDAVIVRVDANGSFAWMSQTWTTANNVTWSNAIACDTQGNPYICGYFESMTVIGADTLLNTTFRDVFLAKYDAGGNPQWAVRSTCPNTGSHIEANAITVDASGNVMIAGSFYGSADFGTVPVLNSGSGGVYIASFTSAGVCQFAQPNTTGNHNLFGISSDPAGNYYVTGAQYAPGIYGTYATQFTSGQDIVIAKLGSTQSGITEATIAAAEFLPLDNYHLQLLLHDPQLLSTELQFVLYDMTGRVLRQEAVNELQTEIDCPGLAAGIYSWSLVNNEQRLASGKICLP